MEPVFLGLVWHICFWVTVFVVHAVEVTTDLDALVCGLLAWSSLWDRGSLSQHSTRLDCGWGAILIHWCFYILWGRRENAPLIPSLYTTS